jgi:hypothetical protein
VCLQEWLHRPLILSSIVWLVVVGRLYHHHHDHHQKVIVQQVVVDQLHQKKHVLELLAGAPVELQLVLSQALV